MVLRKDKNKLENRKFRLVLSVLMTGTFASREERREEHGGPHSISSLALDFTDLDTF
jgi:hypothetical protein